MEPAVFLAPGTGVFLTAGKETTPLALRENVDHNHVLHECVVIVSVDTQRVPHVDRSERVRVDDLGYKDDGILHVNISYGFHIADANPLGSYLDSLQRLRALSADTLVLPSHGVPFHGLQQRVDDLTVHHEEQLAKVEERCREPKTAAELLPTMFRRELKGMHLFLAFGEALAHLEYLVVARRLERLNTDGVIRYALVQ